MDNTIDAEIQGLAERYNEEGLRGLTALLAERINRQQATGNSIYLLTNYTLNPLVGNINLWPKNATSDNDWIEFSLIYNPETNEEHLVRAKIFKLPENYGLLVGRDINQLVAAKNRIVQSLIWGLVIMVLFAFSGGLLLSRRTLRKIERINQTTKSIMSGNLSQRVAVTKHNDDFDQVANNLNQMLDQIQMLMNDVQRVSDNISHDLRTPLTRLRQYLEEAQSSTETNSHYAKNLDFAIKEADSLLTTFSALLRIAQIESRQNRAAFKAISLTDLVNDIVEFYEPLIEEKQQQLSTQIAPQITLWGDRDMLFQAFSNLLENAIKYTPSQGNIAIRLAKKIHQQTGQELTHITLTDNGVGIPDNEKEKVFQRFYRLDQSRSTSGNGLGLAMVSAIIAIHNGSIKLIDNPPHGLVVSITLTSDKPTTS